MTRQEIYNFQTKEHRIQNNSSVDLNELEKVVKDHSMLFWGSCRCRVPFVSKFWCCDDDDNNSGDGNSNEESEHSDQSEMDAINDLWYGQFIAFDNEKSASRCKRCKKTTHVMCLKCSEGDEPSLS